jgi:ABC-2 type transport system ATP-binding protein
MKLSIQNLDKNYRNKIALSNYSVDFSKGITGVLGPNGAGKSTLFKLVATLSKPSSGSIIYNGKDLVKRPDYIRKRIGYLPQEFGVYKNLNAVEFLAYIGAMKGMCHKGLKSKIEKLIEDLNLTEVAYKSLHTYSGGMLRRVGIAQALLNEPDVLIFDEPTVGLDPEERMHFRDLLCTLQDSRIIILSSHIVSDISVLANDIIIMNDGKLIIKSDQDSLIERVQNKVYEVLVDNKDFKTLKHKYIIASSFRFQNKLRVRFISELPILNHEAVEPTLEDAYIYLIKNKTNVEVL